MRIPVIASCLLGVVILLAPHSLFAQGQSEGSLPANLSRGQRDLGVVVLEDFAVREGKITFTAASGGCTTKADFKVTVKPLKGSPGPPHYLLTVERTKADDCKALMPEGVTVVFDLEKDLGLKGVYTFAVANPMVPLVKRPK